jgi:N-acetylglucosamine kinase-like BadF-type ATPase
MPAFDPELTKVMRDALEDVMTRVPVEYSTPATKAYLAECILKAAAQGQTTYNELVTAAANQILAILSMCSPERSRVGSGQTNVCRKG